MSSPTVSRDELEASICRESFYEFVRRFWSEIIPEEPIWNWHIEFLCNELQAVAERVFKGLPKKHDLVINVPPGSTKSTIGSIMFPAWTWTRMPTARSICGSYAYNLAMDLSRKSRDVVKSDKFVRLFGEIELREDQNTKGYFANTQGGSRYAVGTGGSVTGMHGHFIIVDDPLNPLEALSEAELKAANNWMSETLSTRKVDKSITVTILIMQRLHQSDPSAELIEKGRKRGSPVRWICLPGEIEKETRKRVRPRYLAKRYVEGLLDPVRLSREVLKELRSELGEYGYAGQILQHPVPLGGGMFKTNRIAIDVAPPSFHSVVRYWDKAGTADGGAWTVGVKMAKRKEGDHFHYYVLDVVRGQWNSADRERTIRQTAEIDGPKVRIGVEQEPGSAGKESAQNTVRNLAGYRVLVDRPTGDKVIRADPYSAQVNAENVSLVRGEWNREYLEELQFFPFSTYKDQVDASSGAFAMLTKRRVRCGGLRP